MNAKKVLNFFIPLRAISPRNLTSLALVGVFFLTYVLAGGKVTTNVPTLPVATGFGNLPVHRNNPTPTNEINPQQPLDTLPEVKQNLSDQSSADPAAKRVERDAQIKDLKDRLNRLKASSRGE